MKLAGKKEGGEVVDLFEVGLTVLKLYFFVQFELGLEGDDLLIALFELEIVLLHNLIDVVHHFVVFSLIFDLSLPLHFFHK